jgi:hypothetical protein
MVALLTVMAVGLWWWSRREAGVAPAPVVKATRDEAPTPPPALEAPPIPSRSESAPRESDEPAAPAPGVPMLIEAVVFDVTDQRPVAGLPVTVRWGSGAGLRDEAGDRLSTPNRSHALGVTDAEGRARIEPPRDTPWRPTSVGVGRGWIVVGWASEIRPSPTSLDPPRREMHVTVRRAFWISGVVVDAEGRPLERVHVSALVLREPWQVGRHHLDSVDEATRVGGRFDIGPFAEELLSGDTDSAGNLEDPETRVTFSMTGYASTEIYPRTLAPEQRDRVVVKLTSGTTLAGTLVDAGGRPLAGATVAVESRRARDRRGTRTDAFGRWRLEGLSTGPATLIARAFHQDAKVSRPILVGDDDVDVWLVAEEIRLSRPPRTVRVLGMGLCDVDDEIRAAYEVPRFVKVMIFDPGTLPGRLGNGRRERGHGLSSVGEGIPTSVRDAIERLLVPEPTDDGRPGWKRIVLTGWDEDLPATDTKHLLRLSEEDLAQLRETLRQLPP